MYRTGLQVLPFYSIQFNSIRMITRGAMTCVRRPVSVNVEFAVSTTDSQPFDRYVGQRVQRLELKGVQQAVIHCPTQHNQDTAEV